MRIAFLTYGLTPNNTHLMPWRYVFEIAKELIFLGHSVTLVSDGLKGAETEFSSDLPTVMQVGGRFWKQNALYLECIKAIDPNVIYFPVARRSAVSGGILSLHGIPHIAYFPSAWYNPRITLGIIREIPRSEAMVYALESLMPGRLLVKALKRRNVRAIAAITDDTAEHLVECGWPKSRIGVFPPGLGAIRPDGPQSNVFAKYVSEVAGKKCILFMGPSKAIRGIYFLLKAFYRAADKSSDIMLVCLMRHDKDSEYQKLRHMVSNSRNNDRVLIIDDMLNRNDLMTFIRASRAVALPFLLVPSEIPLTVIETLALGKPLLISETGGTSRFVGKAGITVIPNDIESLSHAILEICSDDKLYIAMSTEARRIIGQHPSWAKLSRDYIEFTGQVLASPRWYA